MQNAKVAAAVTAAAGIGTLAYASLYERTRWTLRTEQVPVLDDGAEPLRVLHVSDLHMMPGQQSKQRWVASLADLNPDVVINTGDNLAHPDAVPAVLRALGPLLDLPGAFVFGSNDYFGPTPKNPAKYLKRRTGPPRPDGPLLPWRDLRAAFLEHGWIDGTHRRSTLRVGDRTVALAGVDDPHIAYDRYSTIAGPADPTADLRLGLTHSPQPYVLDAFDGDGYDLVMAGHTHGGQLCVPGFGAIVTNCDLDRGRVKGASRWGSHMWLHVSAGLGTSPYAPVRFACPPEASLLTLVPRGSAGSTQTAESRFNAPGAVL